MPKDLSFLDTSILRQAFGGHTLQKQALSLIPEPHYVCQYAKMEFYRAVVAYSIDLYFEAEHESHSCFADACSLFLESFSSRDLKALTTLLLKMLEEQDFDIHAPQKKDVCRRRLKYLIFSLIHDIETRYRDSGTNRAACSKLLEIPRLTDKGNKDEILLKFRERLKANQTPNCRASKFFADTKNRSYFLCVQGKSSQSPAAKKVADELSARMVAPQRTTCTACSKLGDVIIAADAPPNSTIHALDRLFEVTGGCAGRSVVIHQSTKALLNSIGQS